MHKTKGNTLTKWPYLFLMPYFLFYFMFFIYPTIYSFCISLTNWDSLRGIENRHFIGFQNYIRLITQDPLFVQSLKNTFFFMAIYIPILVVGGLVLAVALYKMGRSSRLFQTINILPYITTPVAIGIIFAFMFDWTTGIINKLLIYIGMISEGINWLGDGDLARVVVIMLILWKNMGYYLLIYLAGLSTVPKELADAAKVDGANEVKVFRHITVPYLRPITLFLIVTSVISGFQLFDEPYLLFSNSAAGIVGGPERKALTSMMYFFDKTFKSSTQLGYGAAVSYGLFVVILVSSLLISKMLFRKENV